MSLVARADPAVDTVDDNHIDLVGPEALILSELLEARLYELAVRETCPVGKVASPLDVRRVVIHAPDLDRWVSGSHRAGSQSGPAAQVEPDEGSI